MKALLLQEFRSEMQYTFVKHTNEQERKQNEDLDGRMNAFKNEMLQQLHNDIKEREKESREELMLNINEMTAHKITEKANEVMGSIQKHLDLHDEQLRDVQKTLTESILDQRDKVESELVRYNSKTEKRMDNMEQDTVELRQAVAANASCNTRSVEWVIPDVMRQLASAATQAQAEQTQSWFSPKFSAAGEDGLQLELQVTVKPPAGCDSPRNDSPRNDKTGSGDNGEADKIVKAKKNEAKASDRPELIAKVNL